MAIYATCSQAPNAHLGWNALIEISRDMQDAQVRVVVILIQDLIIALSLLGQKELLYLCERRAPITPPPCLTRKEMMVEVSLQSCSGLGLGLLNLDLFCLWLISLALLWLLVTGLVLFALLL